MQRDGRQIMICGCGAVQTGVAYSPYYRGLMFCCAKHPNGCRSEFEGEYTSQDAGEKAVAWYVAKFFLGPRKVGSLDPTDRYCYFIAGERAR